MAQYDQFPVHITNSLTRKKEIFKPIKAPFVGMYVCGPTVYSDVHLGNCRTFMTFDIVYRYLRFLGYQVRYVRNITDVGHLVDDADEGEDKIAKKARLEQLEPMEVVQHYTNDFHHVMRQFNNHEPNIEPSAIGHIVEQIEWVQHILDRGYAYEVNGSVYFDVKKYVKDHPYGELSGKVLEELLETTRELSEQNEKRNKGDFAIWKKANPEHIMQWNSPWGKGFPGWHLECSVMSTKYLGETFDIHGGGMDLKFPHHENEIAQSIGYCNKAPANYWMHGNMLTINGQKMSKSLGNSILPHELFTGGNSLLEKGFSPMVVRFFILQTHYSSTLDFSNDALFAAEKGFNRLMNALESIENLTYNTYENVFPEKDQEINQLLDSLFQNMSDDFNTAKTLAVLFDLSNKINTFKSKPAELTHISQATFERLKEIFTAFIYEVLGLKPERSSDGNSKLDAAMQLLIELREDARKQKNFSLADKIRDDLAARGIQLKDGKEGTEYSLN